MSMKLPESAGRSLSVLREGVSKVKKAAKTTGRLLMGGLVQPSPKPEKTIPTDFDRIIGLVDNDTAARIIYKEVNLGQGDKLKIDLDKEPKGAPEGSKLVHSEVSTPRGIGFIMGATLLRQSDGQLNVGLDRYPATTPWEELSPRQQQHAAHVFSFTRVHLEQVQV